MGTPRRHPARRAALLLAGPCLVGLPAYTFAWTPPIGIPAPSFGIDQSVSDVVYTHWVDNSGSCSDSSNGTPASPRCTVPSSLGPGAVVQIRGGPYAIGDVTWTMAGSSGQPVFVRGPASGSRPAFRGGDLSLVGTYFIVENIDLAAGSGGNNGRVFFEGPATHHAALRFSYIHDAPGATGAGILNQSGDDVVIQGNEIARIGVIPDARDTHGVHTGCGTARVWIVDNHIHHNGGDGVQFGHGCWNTPPGPVSVYVGRNHLHQDEENAIDVKEAPGLVVIAENTVWGYRPGVFSGNGDAIRLNDEGTQGEVWVLNNRVYDSSICINPSSSSARSYILGNRLWDCLGVGIGDMGDVTTVVANNTIVNAPRGIDGGSEVRGNVIVRASSCHVCSGVSGCSNNLVWQPGGTPVVQVSCANNVQADPLMVMNGNEQTGLLSCSRGIDAGFTLSAYAYYQSTYGLDIRRDPVGTPRPQGAAWDIGAYEGATVALPSLAIGDVLVIEGNAGTTVASFPVSLSAASDCTVTAAWSTSEATATAGDDYAAGAGAVVIQPGNTAETVHVAVEGDRVYEPDESFAVNLSSPVHATIGVPQAEGTILNDDPQGLSIADLAIVEPVAGSRTATFTVTLSPSSGGTVTVGYSTTPGTATAGADYETTGGTLTFDPGVSTRPVSVVVHADSQQEGPETFQVNLSDASGAPIAYGQAIGRIHDPGNYFTLTPCRVLDTRNAVGPYGGPALQAGESRPFTLAGRCGIPPFATAVAVNVTVTQPTAAGHLRLYPAGTSPLVSSLNYRAGQTRANNAMVGLSSAGQFVIRNGQSVGSAHVVLDVTGYLE